MRNLTDKEQEELRQNLDERKRLSEEINEYSVIMGELQIKRKILRDRFNKILYEAKTE